MSQGNVGKNPPAGAVIDYWLKTSLKKPEQERSGRRGGPMRSRNSEADAKSGDEKKKDEAPKITLEILDSSGKVIRKFPKKEEPDCGRGRAFSGAAEGLKTCPLMPA